MSALPTLRKLLAGRTGSGPSSSDSSYELIGSLDGTGVAAYVGTSRDGAPSILLPLSAGADAAARLTAGLAFWAAPSVDFVYGSKKWSQAAAILECRDRALLPTFTVMAAHLVESLPSGATPSWANVVSLFDDWEKMLRRRRALAAEDELGLWGELRLIVDSARVDDLIAGWQGPDAETVDFVLDATGFEVKTTRRSGIHFVSQSQVERPLGDLAVYFVACDTAVDPVSGRSVVELIDQISDRCSDPTSFERKLLGVGFSRIDGAAYSRRYLLTRRPWLYPEHSIPRVRSADTGVSQLRYRVDLDSTRALAGSAYEEIIQKFAPSGAWTPHGLE